MPSKNLKGIINILTEIAKVNVIKKPAVECIEEGSKNIQDGVTSQSNIHSNRFSELANNGGNCIFLTSALDQLCLLFASSDNLPNPLREVEMREPLTQACVFAMKQYAWAKTKSKTDPKIGFSPIHHYGDDAALWKVVDNFVRLMIKKRLNGDVKYLISQHEFFNNILYEIKDNNLSLIDALKKQESEYSTVIVDDSKSETVEDKKDNVAKDPIDLNELMRLSYFVTDMMVHLEERKLDSLILDSIRATKDRLREILGCQDKVDVELKKQEALEVTGLEKVPSKRLDILEEIQVEALAFRDGMSVMMQVFSDRYQREIEIIRHVSPIPKLQNFIARNQQTLVLLPYKDVISSLSLDLKIPSADLMLPVFNTLNHLGLLEKDPHKSLGVHVAQINSINDKDAVILPQIFWALGLNSLLTILKF